MTSQTITMRPVTEVAEARDTLLGHTYTAIAATVVLVVICCVAYPLLVWGISQAVFPARANGSLVTRDGTLTSRGDEAVGSQWLGQTFTGEKYFHPRPSAAGAGYDATASSGTNLGPLSDKLLNGIHGSKNADGTPNPSADFDGIKDLAVAYRHDNGLAADAIIPADAVTRSGSGLDPHITPQNADLQAARVAKARGLSVDVVREKIRATTEQPGLGILGDPAVNVLMLNLSLDHSAAK